MRINDAQSNGAMGQLIEIYNVNIKTYANLNMWPGTTIYIDPAGWAPDLDADTLASYGVNPFEELGLGGYYNTIKVSHVFGKGLFETHIHAMQFATPSGRPPGMESSTQTPSKAPVTKCGAQKEEKEGEPADPCHGNSPARQLALAGAYGVQELARTSLIEQGEYGEHPPPSSNPK